MPCNLGKLCIAREIQDHGKGGLGFRGVAVMKVLGFLQVASLEAVI